MDGWIRVCVPRHPATLVGQHVRPEDDTFIFPKQVLVFLVSESH